MSEEKFLNNLKPTIPKHETVTNSPNDQWLFVGQRHNNVTSEPRRHRSDMSIISNKSSN